MPLRIGIIAGEASGDALGAGLIQALKKRYPDAVFEGIGGPQMLAQGFHSFFSQDRLAVMGLIEPLKRLPELLRMRRFLIEHFRQSQPDVFIGIDSPDFNLTIEEKLRLSGIKTVHYVSPTVWAWRRKRIFKIARAVDLMITLFPFEAKFYEDHQVPVAYAGHPLADRIPLTPDQSAARQGLELAEGQVYVGVLPGSRGGEVGNLGPLFWAAAREILKHHSGVQFVVPAANASRHEQITQQLSDQSGLPVKIIDGRSHDVLAAVDVVLMASGTVTLEAMLYKRPMVVAYRFSKLGYWILKRLVKTPYVSLPNLLADEPLVEEFVQDAATPKSLAAAVGRLLDDVDKRAELQAKFTQLHDGLQCDASESAAKAIVKLLENGRSRNG